MGKMQLPLLKVEQGRAAGRCADRVGLHLTLRVVCRILATGADIAHGEPLSAAKRTFQERWGKNGKASFGDGQ
jgi:hypothetical protein